MPNPLFLRKNLHDLILKIRAVCRFLLLWSLDSTNVEFTWPRWYLFREYYDWSWRGRLLISNTPHMSFTSTFSHNNVESASSVLLVVLDDWWQYSWVNGLICSSSIHGSFEREKIVSDRPQPHWARYEILIFHLRLFYPGHWKVNCPFDWPEGQLKFRFTCYCSFWSVMRVTEIQKLYSLYS
jgi:hypothetical protein